MVSFMRLPFSSGSICCTVPFPKVWVPIRVPAPVSCTAPATISDALALPPFTSTTRLYLGFSRWELRVCLGAVRRSICTTGPSGTNLLATITDWSTMPPGLSRRSRIMSLMPSPSKCARASSTCCPACSLNSLSLMYPMPPSNTLYVTGFTSIVSRVSSKYITAGCPSLSMPTLTFVPASPLSILATLSMDISRTSVSSTKTILSPALMPARWAGVSSKGAITVI